jgi:prolipoprotein diacylglyceryl transferase
VLPLSIPSPDQAEWQLGPFPLRAYALAIILGIVAAIWIGERRWRARGGEPGVIGDIAIWAVPFGIIGGRLYHVISDAQLYFCDTCRPVEALYVWQGGLGIWGAIAMGGVGAYIGARRAGVSVLAVGDAIAPGIAVAQAIGRWGNYFNVELFGRPTDVPWALEVPLEKRPEGYEQFETFHPTFLYESLWMLVVAGLLLLIERRTRLRPGQLFFTYIALYCLGRFFIEYLRIDPANSFLGLRLNLWTSVLVGLGAIVTIVWLGRRPAPVAESEAESGAESGAEPTDQSEQTT